MHGVVASATGACFGSGGGGTVSFDRERPDNNAGSNRFSSRGVSMVGRSSRRRRKEAAGDSEEQEGVNAKSRGRSPDMGRGWFKGLGGLTRDKKRGDEDAGSDTGDSISDKGRRGTHGGLLGLVGVFGAKDENTRKRDENIHSVKRRIVGLRRQHDDAPVQLSIGYKSRTGWEMVRAAKNNQDCVVVLCPWGPGSRYSMFAVFDGHGRNGHKVSLFVAQKIVDVLPELLKICPSEDVALKRSMKIAERSLEAESAIETELSGTTAVLCLLAGSTLYCANVGDSRAIIGRNASSSSSTQKVTVMKRNSLAEAVVDAAESRNDGRDDACMHHEAVEISFDHTPARADEKQRVAKSGARVDCWTSIDVGDERVWLPDVRIPGLAVTRSFGDQIVKKFEVHARPEITQLTLSNSDSFIITASDGLWSYMSNEEAVDFVSKRRRSETAQVVAEALVKEATERWIERDTVIDDITIVVVYLDARGELSESSQPQVVSVS